MNNQTKKYLVGCIAFVLIGIGLALVPAVSAQDATIEYNYSNESVEYEFNESLFTYESEPYNISNNQLEEYSIATQVGSITWDSSGTRLYGTNSLFNNIYIRTYGNPYNTSSLVSEEPFMSPIDNPKDIEISEQTDTYVINNNTAIGSGNLYANGTPNTDSFSIVQTMGGTETPGIEWVDNGNRLLRVVNINIGFRLFTYDATEPYNASSGISYNDTINPDNGLGNTATGLEYENEDLYVSNSSHIFKYTNRILPIEKSYSISELSQPDDSADSIDSLNDIEFSESGDKVFILSSDSVGNNYVYEYDIVGQTNLSIYLSEDSEVIEGTQRIVSNTSGFYSYTPSLYSSVSLNYETTAGPSISGQSNTIDIYGSGNITIRNEQNYNIITEPVNVTAYGEESGIYSLDTSDGSIDITGLPDQSYTFTVSAGGYYQRTQYIDRLGNIDNLYLLDNSTETVTSQFTLDDATGQYDQDSRLIIQRSIEQNGNDWETIISDSFGSEGLTAQLEEDVRYRLYVENDQQTQLIGPYRATISEQITVSPTSGEISIGEEEFWRAGARYDSDGTIDIRFVDPETSTDSVSVSIYERFNESNTIVENDEYINPEELQLEYDVPNEYNESSWIVELSVTRNGETFTTSYTIGPTKNITPTELDPFWQKILAVSFMLVFGFVFSVINRGVGAIVYACFGGLMYWIGFLDGLTTGSLIVAYLFIAIVYNIYGNTTVQSP